jgi:hypothetical protein
LPPAPLDGLVQHAVAVHVRAVEQVLLGRLAPFLVPMLLHEGEVAAAHAAARDDDRLAARLERGLVAHVLADDTHRAAGLDDHVADLVLEHQREVRARFGWRSSAAITRVASS